MFTWFKILKLAVKKTKQTKPKVSVSNPRNSWLCYRTLKGWRELKRKNHLQAFLTFLTDVLRGLLKMYVGKLCPAHGMLCMYFLWRTFVKQILQCFVSLITYNPTYHLDFMWHFLQNFFQLNGDLSDALVK